MINKKHLSVLVVDDEPDILEILRYNLSLGGYHVITARNGIEAISLAVKHEPHLIILDVMMPEMDGIECCERLRSIPELNNSMIVFLSAREEDFSQLAGFNAGADDYITKPVKPKLLLGKINSLFRRFPLFEDKDIMEIQDLIIDRDEYRVLKNGKEVFLARKEFELLCLLASKAGSVFSRDEILETVWRDTIVSGRTIDVHIRKLRGKLGENIIRTIKGVGYKIALG